MKAALVAVLLLFPSIASAQAWTRARGSAYLELGASVLAGDRLFTRTGEKAELPTPYRQLSIASYAELGVIDRWLTLSFSGELYRRNQLDDRGATAGLGDLRLGAWTGIVTAPLRITVGAWVGLPTGDSAPSAGEGADQEAALVARSLPTGDGELDVEPRVIAGYAFGTSPASHYVVAELGYAIRTRGLADALTYRLELGTRLRAFDRLLVSLRFSGNEPLRAAGDSATALAGLGGGVTHTSVGLGLGFRVVEGLTVSAAAETALRARNIVAALPLRFSVAYEL